MADLVMLMEGFAMDQNGKLIALPMKLPDCPPIPSSTKKSSEKRRRTIVRRPYIQIEPLPYLTQAYQSAKKQKMEKPAPPVCKELFKPDNGSFKMPINRRLTYNNKNKFNFNKTKSKIHETIVDNGSPLLDIEEEENLASQNKPLTNILSKTVLFPKKETQKQNNVKNNCTPVKTTQKDQTSTKRDSDSEFLELEKVFASAKKKASKNDIFSSILRLVIEEKEQFEEAKKQFKAYESRHENRINMLLQLLDGVTEGKENSVGTPKVVIKSPVPQKMDLRKKTLTKALQKSNDSESPRTRNARNMYNTLKNDCSVLCTPVTGKENGVLQSSITRSLSKKLQQQCLLLQDTPKQ